MEVVIQCCQSEEEEECDAAEGDADRHSVVREAIGQQACGIRATDRSNLTEATSDVTVAVKDGLCYLRGEGEA